MPSRKQRRRREKGRRHDYEFVYVDEQGREIEIDPAELEQATPGRDGKREPRREPQKTKNERPVRTVQPPSWGRVGRRALIFFPLIFVAFSVLSKNQALGSRVAVAAVYTLFFIPFMYLMDRTMYRAYLKRTGQRPPPQRPSRRR
jgi:hypothetical protein